MAWRCFLIEPTGECRRWLRRYGRKGECPGGFAACSAMSAPIENGPVIWHTGKDGHRSHYTTEPQDWPRDDPRWPATCEGCHRRFTDEDVWQLFYERLYRLPDGGECTIRDAPVGAMWRVDWFEDFWRGPDGRCYAVQLPPGGIADQWVIEQPSASGGGWTRTGEPPDITARPSILTPRYHGWLTDGTLSDDLEGRTYG